MEEFVNSFHIKYPAIKIEEELLTYIDEDDDDIIVHVFLGNSSTFTSYLNNKFKFIPQVGH